MKKNNFKISIPIAILITLISIIYQRSTGPTYPKKFTVQNTKLKFLRSHGGQTDAPLEIPKFTENTTATLTYKRYPTNDEWTEIPFNVEQNLLSAKLPNQPPAGKLQYFIKLNIDNQTHELGTAAEPILIRFKGDVPTFILAPHIFFMFLSMLLSGLAASEAFQNTESYRAITKATFFCLLVGGMILGPIVQKYAFDVYWAGFPFDWDLTDNKLLIGVLAWFTALMFNLKKKNRVATIMAAIILIGVYSIPHSMMGSQYNYEKGKIETDR